MQPLKIATVFQLSGTPIECAEFGQGHINRTYKILTNTGAEYVLQNINTYVFKDPVGLMENASTVTNYLRERVEDPRMALHFIKTTAGLFYHKDNEDKFWRMYDYVDGFCMDLPETEADFYESAVAFGRFQHQLADFPAETLHETIPNFHNTVDRYQKLKKSIAADACGRLKNVQKEVSFALAQEEIGSVLQRMLENEELPLRVTHNDTKLNNVLFDKVSRKPLCILDLDTVMPGLSVHDFGDSIRFGAATAAEDEQDLSKMNMDLHLFQVYTQGFLSAASALTEKEIEMLPLGALTMTLEVGIRFLTDYLDGDLYFKTTYPEHNLIRARTQLKLVADMLAKMNEMKKIVSQAAANVHK